MHNRLTTTFAAAAMACALAAPAHAVLKISSSRTKGVTCSGGVCTATTGNANLNAGDLQTMLAASDVTVKSTAVAADIGIVDPLTWASTHQLTLDAYDSIHVRAPIVVEGKAGVTLMTNDGGTGGDYTFNTDTSGSITFWDVTSSLVINAVKFTLVKDLSTLRRDTFKDPSGHYALAANYDASPDGVYSSAPVTKRFLGVFEGLGNSILNLLMDIKDNGPRNGAGLFFDNHGLIRDITMVGAYMSSPEESGPIAAKNEGSIKYAASLKGKVMNGIAGGLVGINKGQITSSSSDASIQGSLAEGGLVGHNLGTISYANASAVISDSYQAGGVVGLNAGTLQFASASGIIKGIYVGGVVGENFYGGTIGYCRSSAAVTATRAGHKSGNKTAGGLVGVNFFASITQSFATGIVSTADKHNDADPRVGGLVGVNQEGAISYSYATGAVNGRDADGGGLIGLNVSGGSQPTAITQAYATGAVNAIPSFGGIGGGLIGSDSDTGTSSLAYWDLDTSGISNPHQGAGSPLDDPGVTGLTDAQLKSALPAGFDPNVWGQSASINNGWPYLLANPPQQ